MVISAIVYAMDMFTAINLIIFDHWSGDIKPPIPFTITRWLFGGCIILSFLNLTYEFYGAWAIIRRGSIVESLLDNMAFRYLSRYTLDGQGWQRFLLFTDLGDTKRKVEHLALFTYVSFQAWVRLVICSGPRQLVNASTMYSVYTTILQPRADQRESSLTASMHNLQNLFEDDLHQALVFSSMFISLVWWVLQVVRLLTACVLFLCFIWMWTRTGDRGLYCQYRQPDSDESPSRCLEPSRVSRYIFVSFESRPENTAKRFSSFGFCDDATAVCSRGSKDPEYLWARYWVQSQNDSTAPGQPTKRRLVMEIVDDDTAQPKQYTL